MMSFSWQPGHRKILCISAVLIIATCQQAAADPAREGEAVRRGDEAASLLQQYIQVDTVNPPGNETRAVEFLAAILQAEGIDFETSEPAPGRGNIWARIKVATSRLFCCCTTWMSCRLMHRFGTCRRCPVQ